MAALAVAAGAGAVVAVALAMAMLGYQVSIRALNDLVDAAPDRLAKPGAPIPAGLVSRRQATAIVMVGGAVGSVISASFGLTVLAVGTAGYACGLAYDLTARRGGWGWLCFALAIPLLLVWTWLAAVDALPPAWPILLPLAALAGPALHLSNSLADVEADRQAGTASLATRLGERRARVVLAWLVVVVVGLGWAALLLLGAVPLAAAFLVVTATLLAVLPWPCRGVRKPALGGWLARPRHRPGLAGCGVGEHGRHP